MSSLRHTTQKLIKHGEFQLQRQVLETPNLLQFVGSRVTGAGVAAESVSLTTLRGFAFSMETRKSLMQSFHVLQSLNFRHFPRILAIDSTGPTEDVWVINEWAEARSIREIISSNQQSGRTLDAGFAFYILKSLTSALSTLHRCRVSELKTIHGAISPDTVWISAKGEILLYNYFFGLAAGFEQGYTLEEAVDLRGLGETFWALLTGEKWSGPERANEVQLPGGAGIILEACGLTTGYPCRSTREFTSVLNAVIVAEPYYFSKRYAASWLSSTDQERESKTPSPSPAAVPDQRKTLPEQVETPARRSPQHVRRKFPWTAAAGVASILVVLVILFVMWPKPAPTVVRPPTEGVVSITVEPDVEVVIGDRTYNQATLASVRLPLGDHRIEYRYQGRPIYSESVHVGRGDSIVLQRSALLGEVQFVLVQPPANSAIPIAVQIEGDAGKRDTVDRVLVGPGTRRFTFSAPGYQTSSVEADIVSGKTTPVEVRLTPEVKPKEPGTKSEPKMGFLSVDSYLPVQVWNDGKLLGRTTGAGAMEITLPPSSYNLELRYDSTYESNNKTVPVKIDAATPVLVDANIYISVSLSSNRNSIPESAKVFLRVRNSPEKELGETPTTIEKVPIGGYLVFRLESGASQQKLITAARSIRVDFQ